MNARDPHGRDPHRRGARRARAAVAALVLLGAGGSAAPAVRAQPATVGRIEELRQDRAPVDSTRAVRLTSRPAYARKAARRADALHDREFVELLEPFYVRSSLAYGTTRTRVVAGSSGGTVGSFELQRRGGYEVRQNRFAPLTGLELQIRHGVLLIEHAAGEIDAWAGATRMRITGTTVLVSADSSRADALCFLREGHVAFPEYGITFEGRDVAWRLRDGVRPERLTLGAADEARLQREVRHLSTDVWRAHARPLWRRPRFYLPVGGAALVGAGVLTFVALRGDRASGAVVVPFPD